MCPRVGVHFERLRHRGRRRACELLIDPHGTEDLEQYGRTATTGEGNAALGGRHVAERLARGAHSMRRLAISCIKMLEAAPNDVDWQVH